MSQEALGRLQDSALSDLKSAGLMFLNRFGCVHESFENNNRISCYLNKCMSLKQKGDYSCRLYMYESSKEKKWPKVLECNMQHVVSRL